MITAFYGADVSQAPRDPRSRQGYEQLFEEGELFLAQGNAMRQALANLGCPSGKIVVQHLGVDLQDLPFVARRPDSSGPVRILIAGTFREKKGIPDALRAVDRVRRRYPRLTVTLIGDSAGKAGDEDEKRKILNLLAKLDGTVTWLGFVPYPAFRAAVLTHHLFLSPSVTAGDGDSEGGAPVSIIEAEATGMPILSTLHADIPEVVVDGKSGLLSPERDVDSLAENLERLVAEPALWEPMGRCGRRHVEENFDVRRQVARLEEIYSLVAGHRLKYDA
jgi:colanic acid/amylovoran biosynthesis glycosyltransferase